MHHASSGMDLAGPWPVWLLAALAIGLGAYLMWLLSRDRAVSERVSDAAIDDADCQIMAMLNQSGGAMTQTAIREALGLPVETVAKVLAELEREGKIRRAWDRDQYTFDVQALG